MSTATDRVTVTCPGCEEPRDVAADTAKSIRQGRRSAYCRTCSPGAIGGQPKRTAAYPGPAVGLPRDWRIGAACRDHDPEIWFPINEPGTAKYEAKAALAREICATCPVIAECLEDALQAKDRWAIRGGLDPEQRGEQFGSRRKPKVAA